MLQELFRDHQNMAKMLKKSYEELDLDELIINYCKATKKKDELKKDIYFSAIILKLWYRVTDIYDACKNVIDEDEAYFRVFSCIHAACEDRKWEKNKKLKPQQCVQQIITSRGAPAIFYESNRDKAKANVNTLSLDTPVSNEEEGTTTFLENTSREEDKINYDDGKSADGIVQHYIDTNRIIESIIADTICYNDCMEKVRQTATITDEDGTTHTKTIQTVRFAPKRCIKLISHLPEDYYDYFSERYDVKPVVLKAGLKKINSVSNARLKRYLDTFLSACKFELKNNPKEIYSIADYER